MSSKEEAPLDSSGPDTLDEDALGRDLRSVDGHEEEERVAAEAAAELDTAPPQKRSMVPWVLGVGLVAVVCAVVAAVALRERETLNVPQVDMGDRGRAVNEERLQIRERWNETTGREVNDLKRQVNKLGEEARLLRERQGQVIKKFQDRLDQSLVDVRNVMASTLDSLREMERTKEIRGREDAIVGEWRSRIASASVDLQAMHDEIRREMERLGASEEEIDAVFARLLQESGVIQTGRIAEPEMDAEEIGTLPAYVQPLARRVRDALYAHALTDGQVLAQPGVYRVIRTQLRLDANMDQVSDAEISQIFDVCRVRREELSPALESALVLLIAQQRREVPDRNPRQLEALVWAQRDMLPEMTPGQHLSLIHILGRQIDNDTGGRKGTAPEFRDLTAKQQRYAEAIIVNAIESAYGIHGRRRDELLAAGHRALENYMLAARVEAPQEVQDGMVLAQLTDFLATLPAASETADEEPVAEAPPADRQTPPSDRGDDRALERLRTGGVLQDTGVRLEMGPVAATKRDARVAAWILSALIKRVYPGAADDQVNVPAVVACWEQAFRLSDTAFEGIEGQVENGALWGRAVIPQLMEIFDAGRTLIEFGVPLGDGSQVDEPHYHLYRGVMLGHEFGVILHEPERRDEVLAAIRQDYRPFALTATHQNKIDQIADDRPFTRILQGYDEMGYGPVPFDRHELGWMMDRAEDLVGYATEILASLPPPESWGSETGGFQEMVEEGVRILLPLSMATNRDVLATGSRAAFVQQVQKDLLNYMVILLAKDMAISELNNSVVPMFVNAVADDSASRTRLATFIQDTVPREINRTAENLRDVQPDKVLVTAAHLRDESLGAITRAVAIEVIMARVEPRIVDATQLKGRVFAMEVTNATRSYVDRQVAAPYSVARLDHWAIDATEFAMQMIEGGARGGDGGEGAAGDGSTAPRGGVFPQPGMVQAYSGRGPAVDFADDPQIGTSTRQITIPAASYANAHLISGVDAEIGGEGEPVLVNMNQLLKGPSGSRLYMRNMRFIGTVTPSAGRERIMVELTHLSYVFPSGHQVFVPVKGYVVDEEGLAGIGGTLDFNWSRIMPYAAASGFAGGFAETLTELSTAEVTNVDGGGSVIESGSVDPGDNLTNSVLAGLGDGVSAIDGHIQSILPEFRPSIHVDIGRAITIVLTEPVAFDVPIDEFETLLMEPAAASGM